MFIISSDKKICVDCSYIQAYAIGSTGSSFTIKAYTGSDSNAYFVIGNFTTKREAEAVYDKLLEAVISDEPCIRIDDLRKEKV